jgi:hypothetical protein
MCQKGVRFLFSISHLKRMLRSGFKYATATAFLNQTDSLGRHSYALLIKEDIHGKNTISAATLIYFKLFKTFS